ncbi:LapA family protein [Agrobacterium larrymoorei]|uniref:LapA family protein n=1 Tax=Agrobacterium larrymoorei TaxID=160699 RepID=UPI0015734166|nr:LapA family protein [Agrobacterium larrymoorei]NTJ41189.1 LapA family protein [Agrobacterium larrymoorei]
MSKKIVNLLILVPLAIVLIILCVANRQSVTLALNPFEPSDTVMAFTAPFFVFLFLAVIFGVFLGSFATWVSQGKHRKRARTEAREAIRWHDEATKQKAAANAVTGSQASNQIAAQ